jgi:hypothetical protein
MVMQSPGVIGFAGVVLDPDLVLVDQDVVLEEVDCAIELELYAAVVFLSGWREDFENDDRIEKNILALIGEDGLAADHGDIRVSIHATGDTDTEVGPKGLALRSAETDVEFTRYVLLQSGVTHRATRHGYDLAVQELAAEFRRAIKR